MGGSFPYRLVFNIKGTQITGYSTTKLGNGAHPKTPIKGSINRKNQTLAFTEYPNDTGGVDAITCFVNTVLSVRPINNKYQIKGTFKGIDHFDVYCGEGTITFSETATIKDLMGIAPPHASEQKKLPDSKTQSTHTTDPKLSPPYTNLDRKPTRERHALFIDSTQHYEQGKEYEITSGMARQFYWHSDTCILHIYDGGVIDGDIISVQLNGDEILTKYTLTKQKHRIKLYLKGKVNTISITAENIGKTPPNTANFILTDGKKHYKIRAFNDLGGIAKVILKKK
jgi:hypothetical protein